MWKDDDDGDDDGSNDDGGDDDGLGAISLYTWASYESLSLQW